MVSDWRTARSAAAAEVNVAGQIPQEQLVVGRHYVGRGRNGNVGLWDGESFVVVGEKFGRWVIKLEGYYGPEDGCFQPFLAVDEGRVVEALGAVGWDAHYALMIEFGVAQGEAAEPSAAAEGGCV